MSGQERPRGLCYVMCVCVREREKAKALSQKSQGGCFLHSRWSELEVPTFACVCLLVCVCVFCMQCWQILSSFSNISCACMSVCVCVSVVIQVGWSCLPCPIITPHHFHFALFFLPCVLSQNGPPLTQHTYIHTQTTGTSHTISHQESGLPKATQHLPHKHEQPSTWAYLPTRQGTHLPT